MTVLAHVQQGAFTLVYVLAPYSPIFAGPHPRKAHRQVVPAGRTRIDYLRLIAERHRLAIHAGFEGHRPHRAPGLPAWLPLINLLTRGGLLVTETHCDGVEGPWVAARCGSRGI